MTCVLSFARLSGKYRVLFLMRGELAVKSKAAYGKVMFTRACDVELVRVKITEAFLATSCVWRASLTR